jgi:hypothetical protein
MEGVALGQPLHPEADAFQRAVTDDGLTGVFRAGGVEPAARWKCRRDRDLIEADSPGEEFTNRAGCLFAHGISSNRATVVLVHCHARLGFWKVFGGTHRDRT